MKRSSARTRCYCPNFFSADKHWVFILLIASNFVLFSLIFVLLNQSKQTTSAYTYLKINPNIKLTPTLSFGPTAIPVVTFTNVSPQIKKILQTIYTGQIVMAKNSSNINFYTSKNIQFYESQANPTHQFGITINAYEYIPGKKITNLVNGKKVVTQMDNWVKWLSGLHDGLQETKIFSDVESGTRTITAQGKKIGSYIYFVNDYYLTPATGWIREYTAYDSSKKQIINIIINTQEPAKAGAKQAIYSPYTLGFFAQMESMIGSLSL